VSGGEIWLWLYAIDAFTVKLAYAIGMPIKAIRYIFDISSKPILSLGVNWLRVFRRAVFALLCSGGGPER
jgi:hypothetical protein